MACNPFLATRLFSIVTISLATQSQPIFVSWESNLAGKLVENKKKIKKIWKNRIENPNRFISNVYTFGEGGHSYDWKVSNWFYGSQAFGET